MYLDKYKNDIQTLCLTHKVRGLYVFGSVLSQHFNSQSDIDFLVDIESEDPIDYAENYFELKFKLQNLLQRSIDLLESRALINSHLIKEINNTKQVIYEA